MVAKYTFVLGGMVACLAAPDHHHAEPPDTGRLGTVSFPVSCQPAVQASFEHAIALLHSFSYNAAQSQFQEIEKQDPACAMAFWGDAMTLYRQLWDRPSKEDLAKGHALIAQAQALGTKSLRERAYVTAAAAFYNDDPSATYNTRTAAYTQALNRLRHHFPDDDEAAVFYALSLLASPNANKDDFAYRKRAVLVLNAVLARREDHPGVAHYLIHACDNPEMAAAGLAAARRYGSIAPAAPHALHMPSHIYARLGLWQDSIESNLLSKAAAEQQHATPDRLHAMDFLEYAYLQLGQFEQARKIETEALAVKQADFSNDRKDFFYYVQVHFPALYVLETGDWNEAVHLTTPANAEPDFESVTDWAQAVAAGHRHDVTAAVAAVDKFDRALDLVRKSDYAYAAEGMATNHDEAQAWQFFAQDRFSEAIALLSAVADKQDRVGKGEVEIPAREMLADMFFEAHQPERALEEYKTALKTDPNRYHSLWRAAQAAEALHQTEPARELYKVLLTGREQVENSDLQHAKAYPANE